MRTLLLAFLAVLLLAAPAVAADVPRPFAGHGMWIWQVPRAAGGDPDAIAEQAQEAGIETLYVKGAQGPVLWSQFNAPFVAALQAHGLDVCAYQRMESDRPVAQARAAAATVAAGADCFVIDAETELEGRYDVARRYVKALRKRIGPDYPLGFTSFPYVDYHPLLPYSVFLGEGAATVNLPQIYWKDIGDRPREAFAHTVNANAVYDRPLAPIGQLYEAPRKAEIRGFRRLALAHGAAGLSWWSWDSAAGSGWAAIAGDVSAPVLPAAPPTYPVVGMGARSDYVVWAEDHLRALGYSVGSDTRFDATTRAAVRAFQVDEELPVTGVLDDATWTALLAD
ncbi:MAG TPA: peptidoglycan-binding domain-containing protein [Capillimicrobium sp.]|nr:peptidoglycan-binding domain-containing protein [Capillimicrobium sp.]